MRRTIVERSIAVCLVLAVVTVREVSVALSTIQGRFRNYYALLELSRG
jgi:hypothetical protein